MTTELSIQAIHQGGMRVLIEADGHHVQSDYPLPGGDPTIGMTSLQLLLGALAVKATGIRKDTHPTVLESIHLEFKVSGTGFDPAQLERALDLAEARICPVWVMVGAGTPITRTLVLMDAVH